MALERYQAEGARFFFRGLNATLTRSFIVNAVTLPSFDWLNARYL